MSRNVEIKAEVQDYDEVVKKAIEISGKTPTILKQHDIFFASNNGPLKLRSVEENGNVRTELIWCDRPDVAGPKLSDYSKCDVPHTVLNDLVNVLTLSMGKVGEVKKVRTLVIYGQTRIHIDRVEGLGDFMELEVCLKPEESVEHGETTAHSIRTELGISESDLLTPAYVDMLNNLICVL